jgi:uroporphyrinogen decarboxylase
MKGQTTDRVPVWFMRQAGRYLPEYRELRAKNSMLDCIRTPKLASEITLQPLRRFDFDAAIIFADILNPLMTLGVELDFIQGEGPKIFNPIKSETDVNYLKTPDVANGLDYTFQAIKICANELKEKEIPVLGFSGSPFTLSSYMIEGGKLGDLKKVKDFMFSEGKAWEVLQEKLGDLIVKYCTMQVEAGASAIQLFDSWAGYLGRNEYLTFVLPHLVEIISQLRKNIKVPLVYFSTGTAGILDILNKLDVDVISIDWRTSIKVARKLLPDKVIQGNLDPIILAGPKNYLAKQAAAILKEGMEARNYIFNLGHGIIPETPPENVGATIELVKQLGRY